MRWKKNIFKIVLIVVPLVIITATAVIYGFERSRFGIDGLTRSDDIDAACMKMLDAIEGGGSNAIAADTSLRSAVREMQQGIAGFRRNGLSPYPKTSRQLLMEVYAEIARRAAVDRMEVRPRLLQLLREIKPDGDAEMMKAYDECLQHYGIKLSE